MSKTSPDQIADAATSLERRVAATIADMRGRRGLGQGELAALLGVTVERVARLESGEAGQASTLATLAEIAHRLDFHVTLDLHDRKPTAIAGDLHGDALGDLSSAAVLSTVTLTETLDIGTPTIGFPADDLAPALPDEPGETFVLDEPAHVDDAASRKQADVTVSPPGGGGDGFSDGMSS